MSLVSGKKQFRLKGEGLIKLEEKERPFGIRVVSLGPAPDIGECRQGLVTSQPCWLRTKEGQGLAAVIGCMTVDNRHPTEKRDRILGLNRNCAQKGPPRVE